MSMLDWNGYRQQVLSGVSALAKLSGHGERLRRTLGGAGQKTGRLDAKTRELIALAAAISLRCDGCITVHAEAAHKLGATKKRSRSAGRGDQRQCRRGARLRHAHSRRV